MYKRAEEFVKSVENQILSSLSPKLKYPYTVRRRIGIFLLVGLDQELS